MQYANIKFFKEMKAIIFVLILALRDDSSIEGRPIEIDRSSNKSVGQSNNDHNESETNIQM